MDVGGEDSLLSSNTNRDATAATLVAVDLSTLTDPLHRAPIYRPVLRKVWVGASHTALYHDLLALAEAYRVRRVVIDATGLGAGLASFLERALPGRVTRFVFNLSTKSKLGWDFLSIVDSGRWQEYAGFAPAAFMPEQNLQNLFFTQLSHCHYEVLPGPGRLMRWGVPDGTRDANTGDPVHDDLVMSAALVSALEGESWSPSRPALVIPNQDPLDRMTGF